MAWPTHEDGTNKRIGDMTADERERVLADARERYRDQERVPVSRVNRLSNARMDNWSLGDWHAAAQRRAL